MKVQMYSFQILLVSAFLSVLVNGQLSNLTCKICDRALSLDSCTGSVKCADNEVCFMEELITDELSVVYNGGCRSKVVCTSGLSGSPSIGRRGTHKRADLVACSRCCDIRKKSGELDCNARLCGIKYINTNSTRCYLCDSSVGNADQGDVEKPEDCLSETTCQTNEACSAERVDTGGVDSHKYTCLPKRLCTLLTKEALRRKDECITKPDPRICGNKRKRASTRLCTACCGDGLCNSGSCEQVLDRLYKLWKGGALDFDTLKQKTSATTKATQPPATQPPSTQPPPTKPPSTQAPSTQPPSTQAPSTQPPSTQPPPTKPPSTQAPSTQPPSTQAPSTQPPSTQPPPTKPPSTQAPSTQPPSTQAPSTQPPSTQAPSTQPPSTQAPSTQPPSTQAPSTQPPSTQGPSTQPPSTQAPSTQPPSTQAPSTQPPSTQAPSTQPPSTKAPSTQPPSTQPPPTKLSTVLPPTKPSSTNQTITVSNAPAPVSTSTQQQTPAVAAVVVSQAGTTIAPGSPPTLTPNTVIPPNTTAIIG